MLLYYPTTAPHPKNTSNEETEILLLVHNSSGKGNTITVLPFASMYVESSRGTQKTTPGVSMKK